MAARKQGSTEALMGILDRLERMVDYARESSENSVALVSGLVTVTRDGILPELVKQTRLLESLKDAHERKSSQAAQPDLEAPKQTRLLESIRDSLSASSKAGEASRVSTLFGDLSKTAVSMAKAAESITKTETVKDLFVATADGVAYLVKKLDPESARRGAEATGSIAKMAQDLSAVSRTGQVDTRDAVEKMSALVDVGKGAFAFGASLAGFFVISVPALAGAYTFRTVMSIMTSTVERTAASDASTDGIAAVLSMSRGIASFALSMSLTALLFPAVLVGAATFSLSMLVITAGLRAASSKDVTEGVAALFKLSVGLAALGAGVLLYASLATPAATASAILGVAALSATMWLVGKGASDIREGSAAVMFASLSLVAVGLGVAAFSALAGVGTALEASMGVAVLAVPFLLAGLVSTKIVSGAIALGVASLSLLGITAGLAVYKAIGFGVEDAAVLGMSLVGIGTVFALAGLVSPFIVAGAIGMGVAGLSLLLIAGGMAAFKAVSFTEEDGKNLSSSLGSLVSGFLGGEMPGGLVAGVKFAAQLAARSALLLVAVPPLLLASAALLPISLGLAAFRKSGVTSADGDNLESVIASMVGAFSIITDEDRQRQLGIKASPSEILRGSLSMVAIGNVVTSLAEGVRAMANLEIVEREVRGGKIVTKSVRKMSESDFASASRNVARIITALTQPLADLGKADREGSSGNPIIDAVFSTGYVSSGIKSIADLGSTVSSLGRGVRDFANLRITEYGVKGNKLVPISTRRMSDSDFASASVNIGKVLGFLASEFARVGRMEDDSSGWFSDGYVRKGIDSISGMGSNLVQLAKGVSSMARMEFVENEVKVVSGKPTLVPKKVHVIGDSELASASANIGKILGFLAGEFAKVGRMEDESSGWFSDGYVQKGREAIAGIGKDVSSLVESVARMANSEFTVYEVRNGELVPVSTRKLNAGDIARASQSVSTVVGSMAGQMMAVGRLFAGKEKQLDVASKYVSIMSRTVSSSAEALQAWSEVPSPEKSVSQMMGLIDSVGNAFDPSKANLPLRMGYFQVFSKNMERLGAAAGGLDRSANAASRMEKSMKGVKESINSMDLKKLALTDSVMKSIASIAKSPEKTAAAIKQAIEEGMKELADALREISGAQEGTPQFVQIPASVGPVAQAPPSPMQPNRAQEVQRVMDSLPERVAEAMQSTVLRVEVVNRIPIG